MAEAISGSTTIRLVVGTLNKGKLAACLAGFQEAFSSRQPQDGSRQSPSPVVEISGVEVSSDVSDQPMGLEETSQGARNRAVKSLDSAGRQEGSISPGDVSLGVGLESGVIICGGMSFDVCACAIAEPGESSGEGQENRCPRVSVGFSSMWALPSKVAADLASRGYNECFEELGIERDATGAGVLAVLSGGTTSRPQQMQESVRAALVQSRNKTLYGVV